jgi:succinate-semialdehyde dehydrogenase/glutarate-semialdehyde dehydrogenase
MVAHIGTGSAENDAEPRRRSLDPAYVERLTRRVVTGADPQVVTTHAPFTGQPLADLPLSTPADVGAAFAAARAAQRAWARRSVRERARVLLRFHDLLLERQAEGLDLIQWETGKARKHAFEEILHVALVARHYARTAEALLAPRRRAGVYPLGLTRVAELRHPKGVVGFIEPWNYPLSLGVGDALPALMAGNGVVAKPDTQTALTALWGHELLVAAGMPEVLWQVVLGDGPVVGPAVIDNADYVCFTGSTRTGRLVAQRAAARLVGCSLELGGKNPMLVLADAPIDRAAEGATRACFASAGQLCVATERIYVDRQIYDRFVDRFVERTEAMQLRATVDFTADMGSLASAAQLAKVTAHVEDALAKGAKVLAGGRARPDIGPLFYEPTVLTGVTAEMACHHEETFGPVVAVYPVDSEEEALARANATMYGLNASIWTGCPSRGRQLAVALRAGTVNINEGYAAAFASVDAPQGGMGDSGLGRRNGREGLLKFTESQTVATQGWLGFEPPFNTPYAAWARGLTAYLSIEKRLGRR